MIQSSFLRRNRRFLAFLLSVMVHREGIIHRGKGGDKRALEWELWVLVVRRMDGAYPGPRL
jgi:hypothetical protein